MLRSFELKYYDIGPARRQTLTGAKAQWLRATLSSRRPSVIPELHDFHDIERAASGPTARPLGDRNCPSIQRPSWTGAAAVFLLGFSSGGPRRQPEGPARREICPSARSMRRTSPRGRRIMVTNGRRSRRARLARRTRTVLRHYPTSQDGASAWTRSALCERLCRAQARHILSRSQLYVIPEQWSGSR